VRFFFVSGWHFPNETMIIRVCLEKFQFFHLFHVRTLVKRSEQKASGDVGVGEFWRCVRREGKNSI